MTASGFLSPNPMNPSALLKKIELAWMKLF
jgi:hypothetical protein